MGLRVAREARWAAGKMAGINPAWPWELGAWSAGEECGMRGVAVK